MTNISRKNDSAKRPGVAGLRALTANELETVSGGFEFATRIKRVDGQSDTFLGTTSPGTVSGGVGTYTFLNDDDSLTTVVVTNPGVTENVETGEITITGDRGTLVNIDRVTPSPVVRDLYTGLGGFIGGKIGGAGGSIIGGATGGAVYDSWLTYWNNQVAPSIESAIDSVVDYTQTQYYNAVMTYFGTGGYGAGTPGSGPGTVRDW